MIIAEMIEMEIVFGNRRCVLPLYAAFETNPCSVDLTRATLVLVWSLQINLQQKQKSMCRNKGKFNNTWIEN